MAPLIRKLLNVGREADTEAKAEAEAESRRRFCGGCVALYLPAENYSAGAISAIARGSAIIGQLNLDGLPWTITVDGVPKIEIDYEGNIHGRPDLRRYPDRIQRAHWRQRHRYATVARAIVEVEAVDLIGCWVPANGVALVEVHYCPRLAAWLGVDSIGDAELRLRRSAYLDR